MLKLLLYDIKEWLNKPFPFYENYKQKILIPTVLSLLVMIGLIVLYSPEDVDMLHSHALNVLTYGSIIIFISLIFSLVLPEIIPKTFDLEKWDVKKTIIFLFTSVFTIAISVAILAYHLDNEYSSDVYSFFFAILKRSVILSFLPIIILVFLAEKHLYKKNYLQVVEIVDELKKGKQKQIKNNFFVFAEDTKDEIKLAENKLLFIKAEANYCFLYFMKNEIVTKQLIRSSLKNIERVVSQSDQFIRCHKSYIINLHKVSNVSGNARGYILYLNEVEHKIPVSRNISKALITRIKNN